MIWSRKMPPEKRSLLDIFSKGKYKTSKDLPSMREKIIPALEFMTGATHVPKGQKPNPLNLAFALPVVGKVGKVGRAATKSQWGINRMLQVAEKGHPLRSVVAVQMSKGGKDWIQPFYKSSGTSHSAAKKGKWMPFMGKQELENLPGSPSGKRFYKDTAGGTAIGAGEGWWIKGWQTGKDKWNLLASSSYVKGSHPLSHAGPYKGISKEISRLEKTGYFKHAGTATSGKQINKWLEGYGFNRPRSMSW